MDDFGNALLEMSSNKRLERVQSAAAPPSNVFTHPTPSSLFSLDAASAATKMEFGLPKDETNRKAQQDTENCTSKRFIIDSSPQTIEVIVSRMRRARHATVRKEQPSWDV